MRFRNIVVIRLLVYKFIFSSLKPGIILIDHGHFQYNTMSLGLALWSFHFMTVSSKSFFPKVIGAFLFCMALNFKQMTLYYAPAVFSFLLGKCCAVDFFKRFSFLGITVIFSFALLWWPFYFYADAEVGGVQSLMQVMLRLFPFQRGLFEGKVSIQNFMIRPRINAWNFSLSSLTFYKGSKHLVRTICKTFIPKKTDTTICSTHLGIVIDFVVFLTCMLQNFYSFQI